MTLCRLLTAVSWGALAIGAVADSALAQESLPTIDIGAAQPRAGSQGGAGTPQGPATNGNGTNIGPGANGEICAGPLCNDPTSYSAPVESLGAKVNTPVMNTPVTTRTVTHQMLEDQQVITLDQALRDVSGVAVTGGGSIGVGNNFGSIILRGFQTHAYYRDGIRVDEFGGNLIGPAAADFANVESLEVLKGPAAILYGAVEPGGIINLNLKQPLDQPAYSVQQQIGSYQSYRTTLDATGPLSENKKLLYRFTMSYENDQSFEQYNYTRNLSLNPVIKWNIDANTWIKLETQYQENHFDQFYGSIPFYTSLSPFFIQPLWLGRSWNWGPPSPAWQTQTFSQLTWNHEFDNDWSIHQAIFWQQGHFVSAGTSPLFMTDEITGGFGSNVLQNIYQYSGDEKQAEYATVIDVTGKFTTGELKHTLLIGGDYYRYNQRGSDVTAGALGTISVLGPLFYQPPSSFYPAYAQAQQADNVGVYIQDQIDLPYSFHVLGGARYQYISSRDEITDPTNVCGPFAGPTFSGYGIPCTLDTLTQRGISVNQRVTPRVGLLWRPLEWLSLYGNYVESYSPNYSAELVVGTNQPTPPSAGQQEEAGVKLSLLGNKLQVTADYYHLVKTNIPVGIPNNFTQVELIGEARSQGPELDLQGEILPGWKVNLAYANTDAITTKGVVNGTYYAFPVGSPLPYVPRNVGSLSSTYEFQDGLFEGLKLGARYDYTGYLPFYHYDNAGNYILGYSTPSYGLVGLMASYDFTYEGFKIRAQLNVDNLFDITYFNTGGFGWIPNYLPGGAAPLVNNFTIQPGWNNANLNVYGAPRTIRGAIKIAF